MDGVTCPICRRTAVVAWVEERQRFLVECDHCTTFTITRERCDAADTHWSSRDPDAAAILAALSRYLSRAGEDDERDIIDETRMAFAIEGADEE